VTGNLNTTGSISATGNITGAYLIGNITGNVAGNSISVSGNITGGNLLTPGAVSAAGNVTGAYIVGDGSALSNITGANVTGTVANATYALTANAATFATTAITANSANTVAGANVTGQVANALVAGTVYTAAQPNITSVGILTSASISGNTTTGNLNTAGSVSATGNVTGAYIIGNITGNVTGNSISVSGNITGGNLLTPGAVSAAGNVTGAYIIGNGSALTNITGANVTGNVLNAQFVTQPAQANITSVGTLTSLSVSGNTVTGNLNTAGSISATGNAFTGNLLVTGNLVATENLGVVGFVTATGNVTAGNLRTGGSVSATGNVTGNYIIGNGSLLTNITGANVTGNVLNAQFVTQPAQANITSVGTLTSLSVSGNTVTGNLSAVGNINGANLTLTADAVVQGNLTVNGNTTFINSNVVTINDKFINVANNAATAASANGGGLGVGPAGSEYATLQYLSTPNVWSTNIGLSVTGNVTTGNISATGIAGTLSTAAQPNITSVGTLTSLSVAGTVTSGNIINTGTISSTGNITAPYFLGNVSGNIFGNIDAAGANTQVQFNDTGDILGASAGFTFDKTANLLTVAGNIQGGNLRTGGQVSATGTITAGNVLTGGVISATGNITGGNLSGTTIAGTLSTAAQPNITSVGTLTSLSVAGNVSSGNIINTGTISSTGNVTAPYFIGNIIGNVDAGGSNTQVQFNDNDILNGSAGLTFDKTANLFTVAGNVQGGNLRTTGLISATGNITGSAIFTTGTSMVGNLDINNITSGTQGIQIIPDNGNLTANAAGAQPGRVVFGNGIGGNMTGGAASIETIGSTRLVAYDSVTLPQSQTNPTRVASMAGQLNVDLGGSTWTNKRASGYRSDLIISNGNVTATSFNNLRGAAFNTIIGAYTDTNSVIQGSPANVLVNAGVTSLVQIGPNSSAGNTINFIGQGALSLGNVSNTSIANTQISFAGVSGSQWFGPGGVVANTVIQFYGGTPTGTTNPFGLPNISNTARAAANYYFIRNDDAVAQTQLGSLRSYNEFRYDTATSGSITIDKNNAQVQYIAPTANVTVAGYANMVTTLSDSVNTDQEIDTLTILVQQGATPYTVSLPTGATYQYAGNVSTVPAIANSRSILTVVAANVAGTVNYFTTVQSDGTTTLPAAGANTQIQFNDAGVLGATAGLTFDKTSNALSVTGTATVGNVVTGGVVSATGTITAGNITTTGISNLGSLKTYNEEQYPLATSGTVNIDKNNGQVQYVALTGNVTIGSLQNFVISQGNITQSDTVTLVLKQGATPYTVTMPTGNAQIKYAGTLDTVGNTANSVTMASITAVNASGSALYLITISPEFI
jgi:hypothetical protein